MVASICQTKTWLDFFAEHNISDANWAVSDKEAVGREIKFQPRMCFLVSSMMLVAIATVQPNAYEA